MKLGTHVSRDKSHVYSKVHNWLKKYLVMPPFLIDKTTIEQSGLKNDMLNLAKMFLLKCKANWWLEFFSFYYFLILLMCKSG